MSIQHVGDLEIDQDLTLQRRLWTFQRIGWVVFALIILAALAGFFGGGGPFSSNTASTDYDSARIAYQRFARFEAPASLEVQFSASAVEDNQVRIAVERAFLAGVRIEQITPEPERIEITSDALVYVFEVGELSLPGQVSFRYTPQSLGLHDAWVEVANAGRVTFEHVVYP